MAEREKMSAKELVEQLTDSNRRLPEVGELASSIIEMFGGARALAQEYKDTYDRADNSPMIRSKMLEGITLMIRYAHEKGRELDLRDLSNEDLEAAVAEIVKTHGKT